MTWIDGAPDLVSLAELKAHLRIEHDEEDALLAGMLRSAAATVEAFLGRVLVRREVEERSEARAGSIRLRTGPVIALVAVMREEPDGSLAAVAPGEARLEVGGEGGGRVLLKGAGERPHRVRFLAGDADHWNRVPEPVRMAVMRTAAHFYTHRDAAADAGIPQAVRQLLAPWRSMRLF